MQIAYGMLAFWKHEQQLESTLFSLKIWQRNQYKHTFTLLIDSSRKSVREKLPIYLLISSLFSLVLLC